MNKRKVSIAIIMICVIINVCVLTNLNRPKSNDIEVVIEPTPINMLITNKMSELEETERFDRDIENFMRYWDLKGASFALMYNDSLIYAKGYGYADLDNNLKCDVNNLFRVASISKLLTATAIMKLCEQNKISLSSQVFGKGGILCDSIFLNLYNKNLEKITVEHLLRHTAGFSSPIGDPAFSNQAVARTLGKKLPLSVDDMVVYATSNRLKTTPGGSYDYSNLGYIVLGKIIEKVSAINYESYVQDSILAPAGCYDMYIGKNFSRNRDINEVQYYEVKDAEPVEAFDGSGKMTMKSNGGNDVTLLGSAGGWVASPAELLKFVSYIDGSNKKQSILSDKSIRTMTYYSKTTKPIGWASVTSDTWLRSGSMSGTSALIKRQNNGYTWVFITNSSSWIGPRLTSYISSQISRSLSRVDSWPERNLFNISNRQTNTLTQINQY